VEVGFAAPVVSLVIDGSRVNTYRSRQFTQATAHGRTVGLADVVVRTKVTAYREDRTALAAAVDVRLPTGRTEDLLGAGSASVKLSAIGSVESARLSSHANAGVTIGGLTNELNYAGAVALAATQRVTLITEAAGRFLMHGSELVTVTAPHPTLRGVQTIRLSAGSAHRNPITFSPRGQRH